MARIFTCGFELQDLTPKEWGISSGSAIINPANISISTLVHRDGGLASMRCNTTAANTWGEASLDAGTVKRTLHRLYIRIGSLPSVTTNIYGIGASGYFPALLRLRTNGVLTLKDGFTNLDIGTVSAPLQLNTWYRVELDYTDVAGTAGSVTGAFKGYLNGVLFSDAMCSNINGFSRIRWGVHNASTLDIYFDDMAVNDDTGTLQNGLPGRGTVVALRPDSAGDNNGFEVAVGGTAGVANNYTRVSEMAPNDATSYNETAVTGTTTIDDFNLESTTSIPHGSTINMVNVGGRIGSNAATAASIVYRVKSQAAGTVTESASVSVALNGWATHKAASPYVYQLVSYTEPQAGGPWTKELLETSQIGYRSDVAQTTVRRVSALWAMVEYVTPTPTLELVDDFNDNTIDTAIWSNNFGAISETGGRGRITCNDGFAAFSSGKKYRLKESSLMVRMYAPAGEETDIAAWIQMLVKSDVDGTDMAIEIDTANGHIAFLSRTGYFDAAGLYIPYSVARHPWMRFRETGGNTYFETSCDSVTWETRRTITSPAYVGDGNLEIQLIAHKDAGTASFAEIDNVNVFNKSIMKVWDGTKWVSRSAKVWDGTAWVAQPMRPWDGTQWKVG